MSDLRLCYLVGSVKKGGHDVRRVARNNMILLGAADCFRVTVVCDDPRLGDVSFREYFAQHPFGECDGIILNCGNDYFNTPDEQAYLINAVKGGVGLVFLHGEHPSHWAGAGMAPFPELERMAMLMWREETSHGDYGDHHVTINDGEHPITAGLSDFDTRDELFCTLKNCWGVPCRVLATAYSDPEVVSRHGMHGTGRHEPVAITGAYGLGRVYNQALGHVWPYYTGHGLGENTMLSYAPRQLRQMFVRGCEWVCAGHTSRTKDFDGEAILE